MNRKSIFVLTILAVTLISCSKPVTQTKLLLGTTCTVTLFDHASDATFRKMWDRVAEIHTQMNLSEETSEVVSVNRAAGSRMVRVSPGTFNVIRTALRYSELSGGAFDLTIGPLVKLWGIGTDNPYLPGPDEIREKLPFVDYRNTTLDPDTYGVKLEKSGMIMDLGAIAKGYAADEASRILSENRVKQAIIDFGGNILFHGKKSDGTPWKAGIQNPVDLRGSYVGVITTGTKAVVTSGVYERFFERDGKRYHHILNTETGYPVENGLTSVSIVADRSIDADTLSTTLFALGLEKGYEFIGQFPEIDAIFIDSKRNIYLTPNIRPAFRLLDNSFTIAEAPGS